MNRTNLWQLLFFLLPITLIAQDLPELMGITSKGGMNNTGTLYSLTPNGAEFKVRHSFGKTGPYELHGNITIASDGKIYGVTRNGGESLAGTIYRISPDSSDLEILHPFSETDGNQPFSAPIEGSDGILYGTTSIGGNFDLGIIYSIEKNGANFTVLHHCGESNGANPIGSLLESADGKLYGLANKGGIYNEGTLYRIEKDGSNFELLYSFDGVAEGRYPYGALIEDTDGILYGTLSSGGPMLGGSIFSIEKDSFDLSLLKTFGFSTDDGNFPYGTLMESVDGKIYGNTFSGGADFVGVIFSMEKDGSGYNLVYEFTPSKGGHPYYGNQLLEGPGGLLYGTTLRGGAADNGVIFKLNKTGAGFTLLHDFQNDGKNPFGGLGEINDRLYGTTSSGGNSDGGTIFSLDTAGTDYQKVYDFSRINEDGFFPSANLTQASDLNIYGSTQLGGDFGYGVIFTTAFDGSGYSTLYHFEKPTGGHPSGALLEASDGLLYGNASEGGNFNNGVIYRFDPVSQDYDIIHTFSDVGEIGAIPQGALIESDDGMLYGVAQSGGVFGAGTIFRLNKIGTQIEAIHHFQNNGNTGRTPLYRLHESTDGKLYGVTIFGGSTAANEDGTLFRINKDGSDFEILKLFETNENGIPSGPLVSNDDGYLYGTTTSGGINKVGTIYRISMSDATFETVHDFDVVNGISPQGILLPSPESDWIYGIARRGGAFDDGLVFRIFPDGSSFETLHTFEGTMDSGAWPDGGLLWRMPPVSVNENLPKLEGVSISPNPTTGPVKISFPSKLSNVNAELTIVNENGQSVFYKNGLFFLLNEQLKAESNNWKNGLYFINIKTEEGYFSDKTFMVGTRK